MQTWYPLSTKSQGILPDDIPKNGDSLKNYKHTRKQDNMNEHIRINKQLNETSKTFYMDLSHNKIAMFSIFKVFALKRGLKYKVKQADLKKNKIENEKKY